MYQRADRQVRHHITMKSCKDTFYRHNFFESQPVENIFDLKDSRAYQAWREQKLTNQPRVLEQIVTISNPADLTFDERKKILDLCNVANLAIYSSEKIFNKKNVMEFASQLNLIGADRPLFVGDHGVSEITQIKGKPQSSFVPYSNKPMSWHTDGYYNPSGSEVFGFILHCECPASTGGETALLDPEIVYLQLRDLNPEYIEALMQPDVFEVDANIKDGKIIRPAQRGSVFSVVNGNLFMRFSGRKRFIKWKSGLAVERAKKALEEVLEDKSHFGIYYTLSSGEGVVCNNVLHSRSAFNDSDKFKRRYYRARFKSRIS